MKIINIQNNNNNDVGYLSIKTTSVIEVNKSIPSKLIDYMKNINNIEQPFISDSCVKINNKDENNKTYVSKENPKVTIIYNEYFPILNKNENYKTKYYKKLKIIISIEKMINQMLKSYMMNKLQLK